MWNPVLFAIYFEKSEILKLLLEEYVVNFTLAVRLPPPNEFTEYIVPGQRTEQWGGKRLNFQDQSDISISMSPDTNHQPLFYTPTDARVECFGLELAIRNKDIETLRYLWTEQCHRWDESHFAFVLDRVLAEKWDVGVGCIFRARTSKAIFKGLNPEDKDNFLFAKVIDKITGSEYWEQRDQKVHITEKQVELVVQELQYKPYGNYACLKYPQLFT